MISRRHILGWVAVALIACVIAAVELGLGRHALFSDAGPRATGVRLNERQAEEERMIRVTYDQLLHAGRGILEQPWGRGIGELEQAETIILVRVVKRDPLTFEVLKSWKGPFSPGRVLHVQPPSPVIQGCVGCPDPRKASWQHAIQGGADELLIFTFATRSDEIQPGWAWAGVEARELVRVLDQAVNDS